MSKERSSNLSNADKSLHSGQFSFYDNSTSLTPKPTINCKSGAETEDLTK